MSRNQEEAALKPITCLLAILMVSGGSAESSETLAAAPAPGTGAGASSTAKPDAQDFRMSVMDVFSISGGGLVISGRVAAGSVSVGDTVCLFSANVGDRELRVDGIEIFQKLVDTAKVGEIAGLLVSGVEEHDVSSGDKLGRNCP
jgi:hypothetical protein